MENFTATLLLAFILVMLGFAIFAIGKLITGKWLFKLGSCGKTPSKNRDEGCGTETSCSLCQKPDDDKKA